MQRLEGPASFGARYFPSLHTVPPGLHIDRPGNRAGSSSRCSMATSGSSGSLGAEYDPFLSSPLWLDRNESPLSVMSALARLDIDPWTEAAALAALSKAAALARLSALLGPLPGAPVAMPDREGLCQRVLALLPKQDAATRLPAVGPAAARQTGAAGRQTASLVFLGCIILAGLLGGFALPRIFDRPTGSVAAKVVHQAPGAAIQGFTTNKD